MLKLKKLAVTGSLASGKSQTCEIFKNKDCACFDADYVVHFLLENDGFCQKQVIDLLGKDILSDEKIDRRKVANIVFSNPSQLESLQNILHPLVLKHMKQSYQKANSTHQYRLFVAEMPILFETGLESHFDYVATVIADEKVCKERYLSKYNNLASKSALENEFSQRAKVQMDPIEKAKKSNFIIENNGNFEELNQQVDCILDQIQN